MHQSHPKVAIVLGARGFIGRHTSRALAENGCTVIGIGHGEWPADEARQWRLHRWISADITPNALKALQLEHPAACVVHCAGSGAVSYSYDAPWDDFQRATVTTAAVLEWIRLQPEPRPRLVLVSSAAVYGDQGDTDAVETAVRSPISPYGFHKLLAEILCESSCRFFDVPVSIVRLFSVYGEGLRKQLLWDAMRKFSRGENRFFGTGHEVRDWLHVRDAAVLLATAALEGQETFEVYNGGGSHATTREVLDSLCRHAETPLSPVFSGETHMGNPRRLTANGAHSRRQLNWHPTIALDDGLRAYALWYRERQEVRALDPGAAP